MLTSAERSQNNYLESLGVEHHSPEILCSITEDVDLSLKLLKV